MVEDCIVREDSVIPLCQLLLTLLWLVVRLLRCSIGLLHFQTQLLSMYAIARSWLMVYQMLLKSVMLTVCKETTSENTLQTRRKQTRQQRSALATQQNGRVSFLPNS